MAKKNKKNRPPDYDPNQRKRERIEARRQAKAEALERQRKAQRRERIVRRVGILAFALLAFWFFFIRGGAPDAIAGHNIEDYSTSNGNPPHVTGTVEYDSEPPVSGQHAENVVLCGTHSAPIQNELFVHALEHGAVAVVYEPTLPEQQIRQIEELVASYPSHTISAPYQGEMETPIAVAAWAHIMRLQDFDGEAIREFIDVFRQGGDAPEDFQDCDNDADDEFQPEASPAPGESPGASPAPGETPPGATTPAPTKAPAGSPKPDDDKKRETPAP